MTNNRTKQTAAQANGKVIILPGMQQEAGGVPYFNARLVNSYGKIIKSFKINPETMRPFSEAAAKQQQQATKVDFTNIGGHSWNFPSFGKPQVKSCGRIHCVICSNITAFDVITNSSN